MQISFLGWSSIFLLISSKTSLACFFDVVRSIEEAKGSCSACANKSDAICVLRADSPAIINISLGPAKESIPVEP